MAAGDPNNHSQVNQAGSQNVETPQALKSWWNGFKKKTKKDQIQGMRGILPTSIESHVADLVSPYHGYTAGHLWCATPREH